MQLHKPGLAGLELLKAEFMPQIQQDKCTDGQRQQEQQNNLTKAHENSKGVGD
jgi:hypothetical protein